MVQDLQLDTVAVDVSFVDQNNQPITNARIYGQNNNFGGSTSLIVGHSDVRYSGNDNTNPNFTSATDGVGTLTLLRGLTYNVCAIDPAANVHVCTFFTPTNDTSSVALTAPTHYNISGTLTDRSGNPVSNATLDLMSSNGIEFQVFTDSNGNYSRNVSPGLYKLDAQGGTSFTQFDLKASGSNQYAIDATRSNVLQNLQLDSVTVNVSFVDGNNQPITNARIYGQNNNSGGSTSLLIGNSTVRYSGNDNTNPRSTNSSDGVGDLTLLRGLTYKVCAIDPATSVHYCKTFDPVNDISSIVLTTAIKPIAPTGLTAQSPTNQSPALSWNAANGANHYDVYRDGSIVGSPIVPNFTDTTAANGSHDYYVKAVNSSASSDPSNEISVTYDSMTPNITHSINPLANLNGWNNTDVTVSFDCNDALSGIRSCSTPVIVNAEGVNQTVNGTAVDDADNTANTSATLNIDKTAPVLGMQTWSANPLLQGQNTTLSVPASDALSGLANVKYSVDGGTPLDMTHDAASNTWRATFGSSLLANTYGIAITATDLAGNISVVNDVLAVYQPSNGYVTGHANTYPTASDTSPIVLDTSNNPAKLVIGFTNVTAPASGSFDVNYTVKNKKDAFSLSGTGVSWVVVQDSTHASIQGIADLTTWVSGTQSVTSGVTVRFDIVLGVNGAPDHVTVKIWNPGVVPNIGLPVYVISDDVIANGSNLMIHP